MVDEEPRAVLHRLIIESGQDYARLSKLIGRNAAYIQQYIKRGTPKRLPEIERGILARFFGVEEHILGLGRTGRDQRGGGAGGQDRL
jgi:hypothetical protein